MASFEIEWKRTAARELRKLPKEIMARIVAAVEALAQDPHLVGARKLAVPNILTVYEKVPIESSMMLTPRLS